MATVGVRYLAAAFIDEDASERGSRPTYKDGFEIGKLIEVNMDVTTNDIKLHANDGVAESDMSFSDGSLTINTADVLPEIQAKLLGAKYYAANGSLTGDGTPERIIKSGDSVAPYLGVGYIKRKTIDNKAKFVATLDLKVQFAPYSESARTKGENTEFQTPSLKATAMVVDGYENNAYEEEAWFDNEEDARAWLNGILDIA